MAGESWHVDDCDAPGCTGDHTMIDVGLEGPMICHTIRDDALYAALTRDDVRWMIRSTEETGEFGEPLYWSNDQGWVPINDADTFSDDEQQQLVLPLTGYWTQVAQP